MEYKIPEFELGIIPPIVSVAEEYGDCDTRAVLLCVILEQLGYDSILYLSRVYTHAMTGIHINSTGLNKVLNNKPYYFLEVTNKGWNIGSNPIGHAGFRFMGTYRSKTPAPSLIISISSFDSFKTVDKFVGNSSPVSKTKST